MKSIATSVDACVLRARVMQGLARNRIPGLHFPGNLLALERRKFSREAVAPPDPSCAIEGDGSLNCHGYGSVVSVTATFGQCAAGWVLDCLSGAKGRGSPI